MALLIDIGLPDWLEDGTLHAELAPLLPGVTIHCGPPDGPLPDVTMLACSHLLPGRVEHLPNLQLIQKLGAGVETMVSSPDLPAEVRIARLSQDIQGREIAEYCLTYVLAHQRNLFAHVSDQAVRIWQPRAPRRTARTTVAVLGLGHIGAAVARLFARVGFRTLGWSRSAKTISDVETFAGLDALADREVDLYFGDQAILLFQIEAKGMSDDLAVMEEIFSFEPYALALKRGESGLRLAVDRALSEIYDEGLIYALILAEMGDYPLSPEARAVYQIVGLPE
jgi:hypothetical protein